MTKTMLKQFIFIASWGQVNMAGTRGNRYDLTLSLLLFTTINY